MSSKQTSPTKQSKSQTKLRLRLSAVQRLKKPEQFQTVYKSKQWGGSRHFTFNVLAQDDLDDNLGHGVVGPTVSKKVSKRAVDRNRIKRQIREYYRSRQHEIKNAHLVITAKPSCKNASDKERYDSLDELWVKVLKWQRWHQRQIDTHKII